MILKKSIGVSYVWNENTFSMMNMLGMVIRAHERAKTTNIDYEQLGIEQIDNGSYHLKVLKSEIRAIGRVYLFLSSRMDQEFINITEKK